MGKKVWSCHKYRRAPADSDPIVLFVMSLFPATAVTDDRIASANGAPANDTVCGALRPIDFRLALRRGKCDKDNHGHGALPGDDLAEIATRAEPSPLSKIFDWKRISNSATPAISTSDAEGIGRLITKKEGFFCP